MTKKHWIFIFFLCIAFSMWFSVIFFGHDQYVDENIHSRQINRFAKGNFEIMSSLTTIPGYHVSIALVSQFVKHPSIKDLRLISLLFCLPAIWIFYLIAKKLNARYPLIKSLQFTFLPISFFYFPLVYTDIFSLLLLLIAFYLALGKRLNASALFSLASILVRQTNIVWALFIWLFIYVDSNGFSISLEKIKNFTRRSLGYIFIFASFLTFILLNRGIAIGDKGNHIFGFYRGNLYFFLAIIALLFFPFLITSFRKIGKLKINPSSILVASLSLLIALSFVLFPPAIHEGNLKLHFLRNIVLNLAYHKYLWVYILAIFIGFMILFRMRLENNAYLLFPFIAASLLPSFLVEHRYYIVPLAFLLLFRKESDQKTEISLVLYFILLSLSLLYMLLRSSIFF